MSRFGGEIRFLTICNKRNLRDVLDSHTIELITTFNSLYQTCSSCPPENKEQLEQYGLNVQKYQKIKQELKDTGFGEFVPSGGVFQKEYYENKIEKGSSTLNKKIDSPNIVTNNKPKKQKILDEKAAAAKTKTKLVKRKPRYNHWQPVYTRIEDPNIEELLIENKKLAHRLSTFSDDVVLKAIEDLNRYKIVQNTLYNKFGTFDAFDSFNLNCNTRQRIMYLLGDKCNECGSKYQLTLHHIIFKKDGGSNNISNLQVLCRKCHDIKHVILSHYTLRIKVLCNGECV